MILFPAIDLRQGRCVRLRQGRASDETVYDDDPAAVARRWVAQGAQWLHVVNLDGALGGADRANALDPRDCEIARSPRGCEIARSARDCEIARSARDCEIARSPRLGGDLAINLRRLAEIRAAVPGTAIQFGGGLRRLADVEQVLALGATRVVLGTAAVRDPGMVADALCRFGPACIVVGIDARDGRVATHGWQQTSERTATALGQAMARLGVARLVYTDIARDGMLSGANVQATVALARASGLPVIASGGVASLDDVARLAAHRAEGIEGVIVGQALYTGALSLPQAIRAARTDPEP
jgi:phosphoribosylformimino-5-aminoimidazole carboxamide ribotide isomerase